jgi:hypothetical protein
MKKDSVFLLLIIATIGAFVCLPFVIGAPVAPSFQPSAASVPPLLAQASAPDAIPFYASDTFWAVALALVSGIVAILRNKTATTAQKINAALVLGIEQATQLPEVAAAETKVKNLIRAKAQQAGVEPILNRIVKDLTP